MKTGVAYIGIRDPECIRKHMDTLVSQGYTHVCHPYSESDFKYYRETMREIISVSVEYGLGVYVIPWGIGKVFDGETFSELFHQEKGTAQINNHGKAVPAACLNSPLFREYLRSWVKEVCSSPIETILWDDPHFYYNNPEEQWCCRCENCKKLFRKTNNHLMPNSITESVNQFRRSSILDLISEVSGLARVEGKRNAVSIPLFDEEGENKLWKDIGALPTVDELVIKPFWDENDKIADISQSYRDSSKKLMMLAGEYGKETQVWVKNFLIPKNNEEGVAEATYASYNEGVRNIFAWAHDGTRCMSAFRSDNPGRVWKIQTDAFAECHDKAIVNEMILTLRSQNSGDK